MIKRAVFLAILTLSFATITFDASAKPVYTSDGYRCTIIGTSRSEYLKGTSHRDVICGLGGNDVIRGASGNDIIDGGAGNDTLYGDAGNDTIHGGSGNDTINGGTGTDTIQFTDSKSKLTISLLVNKSTGAGTDKLSSIENVIGGRGDDIIIGSGSNNYLVGGFGNDRISAGKGNDRLNGGSGNDLLDGGRGKDTFDYSSAVKKLSVTSTGVNVNLASGVATGFGVDTLTDGENIIGSAGDDILIGDEGENEFYGGQGNDELVGGEGEDTVDYSLTDEDLIVDMTDGTIDGLSDDTFDGFEDVITGSGDDEVYGDDADNIIDGGAGDDAIYGSDGDDIIDGGAGDDTLSGETGSDEVDGGSGTNYCDLEVRDIGTACLEDAVGPQITSLEIDNVNVDLSQLDPTLTVRVGFDENFGKMTNLALIFQDKFMNSIQVDLVCTFTESFECARQFNVTGFSSYYDDASEHWYQLQFRDTDMGTLISGDKFHGVYEKTLSLKGSGIVEGIANNYPTNADGIRFGGTYNLVAITATDAALNTTIFNTSMGMGKFSGKSIHLVNAPIDGDQIQLDSTAPHISTVSVTTQPESGSGQLITVDIDVEDAGVGFKSATLYFAKVGEGQYLDGVNRFDVTLKSRDDCESLAVPTRGIFQLTWLQPIGCMTSGTKNSGHYRATFTLPRNYKTGTYKLSMISAVDLNDNQLFLYDGNITAEVLAANPVMNTTFMRDSFTLRNDEDYSPAELTSISWGVANIDTGHSFAWQTLDLNLQDTTGVLWLDISIFPEATGNSALTMTNALPSNEFKLSPCSLADDGTVTQPSPSSGYGGCFVVGDKTDGTYRLRFFLPQSSRAGAWKARISVIDEVGNQWIYSPAASFTNSPT